VIKGVSQGHYGDQGSAAKVELELGENRTEPIQTEFCAAEDDVLDRVSSEKRFSLT
jgi:hypothetical protein